MAAPLMLFSRKIFVTPAPLQLMLSGGGFYRRLSSCSTCRPLLFRPSCSSTLSVFVRQAVRVYSHQAPANPANTRNRAIKGILLSIGLVGAYTAARSAYASDDLTVSALSAGSAAIERPSYKPDRIIRSDTDGTGLKLTLFQYQTCPFCCKVRAYLDHRGLSYEVVEVNSVRRNQIKWSHYKKVPILVCEPPNSKQALQLNDSSLIISALESFLLDPSQSVAQLLSYYPELESENERGKKVYEYPNKYFLMHGKEAALTDTRREEQRWRQWTDDVLVHTLSPNIYVTPAQALEAFRSFSVVGEWDRSFSAPERWFIVFTGATAMFFVGKLLKKRYNLKEDVRESLYDACNTWMKAVKQSGGPFLGGTSPNLADLAVYGELNAIEGCQTFRDLLDNTHVGPWYTATKQAVAANAGRRTL